MGPGLSDTNGRLVGPLGLSGLPLWVRRPRSISHDAVAGPATLQKPLVVRETCSRYGRWVATPDMVCDAIVDPEGERIFFLAFDLLLAEAPIRDGHVYMSESHVVVAPHEDVALASWHAAVRAALLKNLPGFVADREQEITRANEFALRSGRHAAPSIPEDRVASLALHRDRPAASSALTLACFDRRWGREARRRRASPALLHQV